MNIDRLVFHLLEFYRIDSMELTTLINALKNVHVPCAVQNLHPAIFDSIKYNLNIKK